MNSSSVPFRFLSISLVWLLGGLCIGIIGAIQYRFPTFLFDVFSFQKARPVHVTLAITWIIHAAVGSVYYYLPETNKGKLFSLPMAQFHFMLAAFSTILITGSFFAGFFGGREYLEYPPALGLLVALSWILFLVNFFKSIRGNMKDWPVYQWMWMTGILFFLFTYTESFLWMFSYFGNEVIRDITVQWKSLGSMVGSWNMLIYGTSFYVMEKISGDLKTARSPLTFFFYFLGLTNLMFNWGHHTYIVPAAYWIKDVSYFISMTELLILGSILWNWKKTVRATLQHSNSIPYRFLAAADVWIFLNLVLAIAISVPDLNYYTHGTHITVAHAMGATIGINSMLLFASIFYILSREDQQSMAKHEKEIQTGYWLIQAGLFIFWLSLIVAGIIKAATMVPGSTKNFYLTMQKSIPVFDVFLGSGCILLTGFILTARIPFCSMLKLSRNKAN